MKSKLLLSIVGLTAMFGVNSVQAAPVIFFGEDLNTGPFVSTMGPNAIAARTSFLGTLTGVGNENFESFSNGTGTPLNVSFPGSVGSLTAAMTSTGGVSIDASPNAGRFASSGTNYLEVSSGANFTLTFGTAIGAFGFFGTDIGDFVPSNMIITLTDINSVVTQQIVGHTVNSAANNNTLFWGFTDTSNSYTSISFSNPGGGDTFGFDDMVIGDQQQIVAVAEPGALAILGLGLIGLAYARRKRTA